MCVFLCVCAGKHLSVLIVLLCVCFCVCVQVSISQSSLCCCVCLCVCVQVSICLECNSSKLRGLKRKWIRCSAQATVLHLKKFIAKKLNLTSFNEVQ